MLLNSERGPTRQDFQELKGETVQNTHPNFFVYYVNSVTYGYFSPFCSSLMKSMKKILSKSLAILDFLVTGSFSMMYYSLSKDKKIFCTPDV